MGFDIVRQNGKRKIVVNAKVKLIRQAFHWKAHDNLSIETISEKEKNDLLLGSILKERNLYKFTRYKNNLEEIFKLQKQD